MNRSPGGLEVSSRIKTERASVMHANVKGSAAPISKISGTGRSGCRSHLQEITPQPARSGVRRHNVPDRSRKMEHVAAIMMLVGCGYGNVDCHELPASAAAYETMEDCQERLRPTVATIETSAKLIFGKCEAVDPALFIEDEANARIRWSVTPDEELHVSIDVVEPSQPVMVASR
jgi:hypothetical protein